MKLPAVYVWWIKFECLTQRQHNLLCVCKTKHTHQQVLHMRVYAVHICYKWFNVWHRYFARLNKLSTSIINSKIALMCIFIFQFEWCYKFCVFPHSASKTRRTNPNIIYTHIVIAKYFFILSKTSLYSNKHMKNQSIQQKKTDFKRLFL